MPKIGERFNPNKLFDGIFLPMPVARYKGLSPGSKLIWARMYRFCGERGDIFPAVQTLADDTGMSESQARRYIHEMVEEGFLEIESRSGTSNVYYYLWHSAFDGNTGKSRIKPPLSDTTPLSHPTPLANTTAGPSVSETTPLSDTTPEVKELITDLEHHEITTNHFLDSSLNSTEGIISIEKSKSFSADFSAQSTSYNLQLDENITTLTQRAYTQRKNAEFDAEGKFIKGKLTSKANERLRMKMERLERQFGPAEFRLALWLYLDTDDKWLSERKWPLNFFLSNVDKYLPDASSAPSLRSNGHAPAHTSSEATAKAPARFATSTPFLAPEPDPLKNPLTYIETWNTIVYDSPVDVNDIPEFTMAFLRNDVADKDFQKWFERICNKCQRMIQNGHSHTFVGLFGKFPKWKDLCGDKFDWQLPKISNLEQITAKSLAAAERAEREAEGGR